MSAGHVIKYLATEFAKLGIPPSRVEIVLAEADVERLRRDMHKPSRNRSASSVQKIAGVLVSGIATDPDHSGMRMGDLLD